MSATGNNRKKGGLSSLVKISGRRRARDDDADDEVDPVFAAQRSEKWHDMPYAALQLIALYNCETVNDAIVLGLVYSRLDDTVANYLPADVWRRFYDHLVNAQHQIPEKQVTKAELQTPDTLQTYSQAARYWYSFPLIVDARALREVFRGAENLSDSWKMQALGTVAEWEGVEVQSSRVTGVNLHNKSLQGSVDLTKLPARLQFLYLDNNKLSGLVDLTQLPAGLGILYLYHNKFEGSVDLTRLPTGLQFLHLENNKLSGLVNLTQLPAGLRKLYLYHNKFEGSVDLTQLPTELLELLLGSNKFEGSLDLAKLPEKMQKLSLFNNSFSGSVDLTQLPTELLELLLGSNQLSGSVDFTQLPTGLQRLWLYGNELSGSVDLTQLPAGLRVLFIHNNKFSGSTSMNTKTCNVTVGNTVKIIK